MSDRELRLGTALGRYMLSDLLGQGAMGVVYRARDTELLRDVALKVVRPRADSVDGDIQRAKQRIFREARAAASLEHPNVVRIYDVGEIDQVAFVAMELVKGRSLRSYVGQPGLPFARRGAWLVDIARALGAAHTRGLVHRDVKPDNVMISTEGVVKVLDFGIARAAPHVELQGVSTLTEQGCFVGTPHYMAPEQLRDERVDARADQFAWGVVAFELLSGTPPWSADGSMLSLVSRILSDPPPKLSQVAKDISPAIERVVTRTLSKVAADRYPSMDALLEAFEPLVLERSASSGPALASVRMRAAPPEREGASSPDAVVTGGAPSSTTAESGPRPRDGFVLTNLAYEMRGDLVIGFMNDKTPTHAEHLATLDILRQAAEGKIRRSLCVTLGGAPTVLQRKALNEALGGRELPTAIVSDSAGPHRAVAALAWYNTKIRAFSRAEMDAALSFLAVPRERWPDITACVEALERQIAPTPTRSRSR